jgi:hypothetical protein
MKEFVRPDTVAVIGNATGRLSFAEFVYEIILPREAWRIPGNEQLLIEVYENCYMNSQSPKIRLSDRAYELLTEQMRLPGVVPPYQFVFAIAKFQIAISMAENISGGL